VHSLFCGFVFRLSIFTKRELDDFCQGHFRESGVQQAVADLDEAEVLTFIGLVSSWMFVVADYFIESF